MRIIFLGTPEFALPTLKKLTSWAYGNVVAVVTQPDRPSGRGNKIHIPPTKSLASALNIPVFQPEKLSKAPHFVQQMQDLKPDVLVTAAFGQILKEPVLKMAPYGVINLHGSLLPKYRGAAPINWAIIKGETKTGVTTMFSDAGIDTGPMLLKKEVEIGQNTTAYELAVTLAEVGADLVIETLEMLLAGRLQPLSQNDAEATYAPLIKKELGKIDWLSPAQTIHNLVRGLVPWPGTYTTFNSQQLKILGTAITNQRLESNHQPGSITLLADGVFVACGPQGEDVIELIEVQPANRQKMKARAWANGVRLKPNDVLGP